MGKIVSGIFGGGGSGGDAAGAQNGFIDKAIEELRRQFDITQENITPFLDAGTDALGGVIQGTTAGGLDERLAEIFNTDIFGSLVDERTRAVEGQLSAGGLTRSGGGLESIANVPTSIGLALEELLSGRLTNLAGSGQNAATGLGSLGAQNSSNIASLISQQGKNVGSGILADQQADAKGAQNLFKSAATAAAIFFSDPALKENVEKISDVADLSLCQWDWIPETEGTIIEKCGTIGFMADEVKEKYPQHVSEYGGFMVIDYPALLDQLQAH